MADVLYVALQDEDKIASFAIDPGTGGLTRKGDVAVAGGPSVMAQSPDGRVVYVGLRTRPAISSFRVDPATGALTQIGLLNNAASGGTHWISSGDVVSIKDGGTYLTVKAQNGNTDSRGDRIVEVDPKTCGLVRIIGATGMDDVLGLGYWGGVAYGFTLAGRLIQIDLMTGAGTVIPIPNAPSDLSFLGAGTTTVAPTTIIFE